MRFFTLYKTRSRLKGVELELIMKPAVIGMITAGALLLFTNDCAKELLSVMVPGSGQAPIG